MQNTLISANIQKSWEQYISFADNTDTAYGAIVEVSEIYHVLKYFDVDKSTSNKWINNIRELNFSSDFIKSSTNEMMEDYEYVSKVLSIGDYWNDDEWLLVLLYRLQLELAKDFFIYKGYPYPNIDLEELYKESHGLSQTKKNKKSFNLALTQMKKNSPLPFKNIWFRA